MLYFFYPVSLCSIPISFLSLTRCWLLFFAFRGGILVSCVGRMDHRLHGVYIFWEISCCIGCISPCFNWRPVLNGTLVYITCLCVCAGRWPAHAQARVCRAGQVHCMSAYLFSFLLYSCSFSTCPVCHVQPITSIIRGVNLVEKEEKGFIFSSTIQKLTFSVQLSFPREALLRLQVRIFNCSVMIAVLLMTLFFPFIVTVLDLHPICSAPMMISLIFAMGWKMKMFKLPR